MGDYTPLFPYSEEDLRVGLSDVETQMKRSSDMQPMTLGELSAQSAKAASESKCCSDKKVATTNINATLRGGSGIRTFAYKGGVDEDTLDHVGDLDTVDSVYRQIDERLLALTDEAKVIFWQYYGMAASIIENQADFGDIDRFANEEQSQMLREFFEWLRTARWKLSERLGIAWCTWQACEQVLCDENASRWDAYGRWLPDYPQEVLWSSLTESTKGGRRGAEVKGKEKGGHGTVGDGENEPDCRSEDTAMGGGETKGKGKVIIDGGEYYFESDEEEY